MPFHNDIARGNYGEKLVYTYFKSHSIPIIYTDKKNRKFWDLQITIDDRLMKLEVKYDEYESKSGNIAVEIFNSKLNKPSGIYVTKSDFWIYVLKNKSIWIAQTKLLRKFILKTQPLKVVKNAGDGNADLLLYKNSTILDIFNRIDNIDDKEYLCTLLKL